MARRDQGSRDDRRHYEIDDPYDRDEGETYGQYGNLHRGLGYGGGRDPENLERFGRGRDPGRYPFRDRGRGDEADHRGKGPRGYRRSDDRILEDVNDRLTEDRDVDASDISVTVKDGEVTLSGHVQSRLAKRAAEDCAESVSGVTHVQNNLRISAAAG